MPSFATLKLIGGGAVILAILMLFAAYKGEQRHSAKLETQLVKAIEGRKADRIAYETAQRDAAVKNKAQVATIEAEQEKISAQQKSDFARDLARVRAGGVRQDLAAPQRPASGAQAGSVPAPACRDDEANLCVSRTRVMQAAEIELGRNALIDWIERQAGVIR